MTSEQRDTAILLTIIAMVLLLGTSLLIAVINIGAQIASFWLIFIVQLALAALVLAVVFALVGALISWIISKFAELYRRHEELLTQLKKRTPWFIALTLLVAQASLAIADKSFRGEPLPTVAITLALILLFFLANELMTREQRILQTLGLLTWFLAIAALPFFVWIDRGLDIKVVLHEAAAFPLTYKVLYGLITLLFFIAPLLFIPRKEA